MTRRIESHWGWGYADRFPDRSAREGMCGFADAMLGFAGLRPEEPVALEAVQMPKARADPPVELEAIVRGDRETRARHTYGKAYRDLVRGFRGDYAAAPDLVAEPKSEEDVERILDFASTQRLAVVPFGGGTSVVGGVECSPGAMHRGVLCLDLRGLDRVVELDEVSFAARIQAGATGPRLESQLSDRGFTLRHYPQSYEHSTLGGWIATRAGGHFATNETRIDDFVESTRMLTPAGWYESRRLPGSGAGPSPDASLVLGSEGTLGVITEAWVRVLRPPKFRARANILFSDFHDGARAVRDLAQSRLYPSNCRLLDPLEAKLNSVSSEGQAVLLLAFESADHELSAWLERGLELCRAHGGIVSGTPRVDAREANEPRESDRWKSAFFDAPYLQNVMVSIGVVADTFETACTWDRFESLDQEIRERLGRALREVCGEGHLSCRITHAYPDGVAPYFTFLGPARRGAELEQWMAIKEIASRTIIDLGATITHHHAVGRVHRPWYDEQRPGLYARSLRAVKQTLDPSGLLNPGVLIDPSSAP